MSTKNICENWWVRKKNLTLKIFVYPQLVTCAAIQRGLLSAVTIIYCKFGNFREGFIFESFVKIKSSRNGEVTLSFTVEGKSCHSREFLRRKYFS